jgi:hypothetical protein
MSDFWFYIGGIVATTIIIFTAYYTFIDGHSFPLARTVLLILFASAMMGNISEKPSKTGVMIDDCGVPH